MGDHRSDSRTRRFHDGPAPGATGSVPIDDDRRSRRLPSSGRSTACRLAVRATSEVPSRRASPVPRTARRRHRCTHPHAAGTRPKPNLRVERALQRDGHRLLAGMDEVGRGALAGPVTVGVVVIDETCRSRAARRASDSKLLTPHARGGWCRASSAGRWRTPWGTPAPTRSTRSASSPRCAWPGAGRSAALRRRARPGHPRRQPRLAHRAPSDVGPARLRRTTRRRADAAGHDDDQGRPASARRSPPPSVLAKVERDGIMVGLGAGRTRHTAGTINKGYAAPEHIDALRALGPCDLHRRSWRLPGMMRCELDRPASDGDGRCRSPTSSVPVTDRDRPTRVSER